jgi:hypothetical protein
LCKQDTEEKLYFDDDKKKPVRIKVMGPDSDPWTAFARKHQNQSKMKSNDDVELEEAKLYAKMTIAWENIPKEAGECTHENALKLYKKYKGVRVQITQFVVDRSNFTQKPLEA